MNDIHHDHEPEHDQDDHVHEHGPLSELVTVRDWLRYAVSEFNRNKLFFGHGCSDAFDEAVWLVLHTLSLPLDRLEPFMDACVLGEEREALMHIIERRVKERIPAAYLTQEAWLGDYRFYVDERVIVPRSFFAELLEDGFAPWVQDPAQVQDTLDLCTGSACLAILMAETFPDARVAAVDLSADALEVAHRNVAEYGLQERVELFQGDLFEPLGTRRFDLIITNPPYVTAQAMAALPPEYRHEPGLALGAGEDGLDVVRGILAGARQHLTEQGVLAVEIGHNRDIVEAAFPDLPFTWLSAEGGECVVFVLNACDLP